MFRTFRFRLLFWFLVFISSSFIIIVLSVTYLQKREAIFARSEAIDQSYLLLLKGVQAQKDFFSYETKNANYFLTGKSEYLDKYRNWIDSTLTVLRTVDFSEEPQFEQILSVQMLSIQRVDSLFLVLTDKIKVRGFKDYSLEGAMRDDAHWLEDAPEIASAQILSLRRHEKDYIIRNETEYVDKFTFASDALEANLQKQRITPERKRLIRSYLQGYKSKFLQLVQLDKEIGIKDNSGLKLDLDINIDALETGFSDMVNQTRQWARSEFDQLTLYFGLMVIFLVLISIIISAFIASKITEPLRQLTAHITRFVDSNFTLEKEHPEVKSKDEIGSLTKNFSILKNEVISQMRFFKQRVDERTEELAEANKKLARLSEANSRFVPKEFLQNLNRKGIEDVLLGDHVEREMTVVFTDIRGFTKISEELTPQQNFDFLNQYLSGIVPIILKHGGFIDKFIGDSVMALFPNAPDNAIKAVMEFEGFMKDFNDRMQANGQLPPILIGSGIHTGSMILGTIGHDNRLETTVISDAVNTAARVEGLTKFYDTPVIVTEETLLRLGQRQDFHYRFLDKVKVKGKQKVLSVYQFLSPSETLKIGYMDEYNQAMEYLDQGKQEQALDILSSLCERNPDDKAVKRFIDRYSVKEETNSTGMDIETRMTKK